MTANTAPRRSFTTPAGGITTIEVGAITGDVEAWLDGDKVRITYVGAGEAYTVAGKATGKSLDQVVEDLTTDPGADADGNPKAARLA